MCEINNTSPDGCQATGRGCPCPVRRWPLVAAPGARRQSGSSCQVRVQMRSVQRGGFDMRTGLAVAALGILVMAGGMMLAAPARAGQDRPGQIGQARVFVENTGKNQAVPVALQDAATDQRAGRRHAHRRICADGRRTGTRGSPGMGVSDGPDSGGPGCGRRVVGRRRRRMGSDGHPVGGYSWNDCRIEAAALTRPASHPAAALLRKHTYGGRKRSRAKSRV